MKKILVFIVGLIFSVGLTTNAFAATVQDPAYTVEEYVKDLIFPTTMSFLDSDILILEKNDGKVRLVRSGILQPNPVLDLPVNSQGERGLLGIETVGNNVYLDFTEALEDGGDPLGNRVYRYSWDGSNLSNPVLLMDMPAEPAWFHTGGALAKDLNGNVFTIIGDVGHYGILQNYQTGEPNDTSVIVPVDPAGPYVAMGIRNSFGLAFDPLTGNMWDTENGELLYDEINLVPPKFNSGWGVVMGPATPSDIELIPDYEDFVYSDPEFTFVDTIAPTSIFFIDSEKFPSYSDTVLVGNCNLGSIYQFKLNESRDSFQFSNSDLSDFVLDVGDDFSELEFGSDFGCITDIEQGPDGFLYVVSLTNGIIYRIVPTDPNNIPQDIPSERENLLPPIPEWIKNTAEWWASDQISETEFLQAIEYLIENDIMKISTGDETSRIPTYFLPSNDSTEIVDVTGVFPEGYVGLLTLAILQPDGSEEYVNTINREGSIITTFPLSNESPVGTYHVFAVVGDRVLHGDDANTIKLVFTFNVEEYVESETTEPVPEWIKNNADWWSQGLITDNDFVKGITYLIERGIITV